MKIVKKIALNIFEYLKKFFMKKFRQNSNKKKNIIIVNNRYVNILAEPRVYYNNTISIYFKLQKQK